MLGRGTDSGISLQEVMLPFEEAPLSHQPPTSVPSPLEEEYHPTEADSTVKPAI